MISESYQNTVEMVEGHYNPRLLTPRAKPGLFKPMSISSASSKIF